MEVVVAAAARGGGDAEHEGAERQHLDDEVRLGLGVLGGLEQFVERELVGANEVFILTLRCERGDLFFVEGGADPAPQSDPSSSSSDSSPGFLARRLFAA